MASRPMMPPSTSTAQSMLESGINQQPNIQTASAGVRLNASKRSIYDRNLNRSRTGELSKASFAFLFSEMVTYAQRRVTGIADLEKRLNNQGYPLGLKLLDLMLYRSPTPFSSTGTAAANAIRPTHILPLLQFISTTLWRHLFGRPADALERSQDAPDEYMITDNEPLVNAYISVPKEMNQLNCAAYVAGIIEGVCDGCGFFAKVTAHSVAEEEGEVAAAQGKPAQSPMWPGKTVFLVKFSEEVMEREDIMGQK